jgi:hypothetical protein
MLPYFHQLQQARRFLELVDRRAKPVLLVETKESAAVLDALCDLPGLSEVHIGLNDLSISMRKGFLFDVIMDGTVDGLCAVLRGCKVPFGFGGIGSLSRRDLPVNPQLVLAEQVCQGATRGWLGRTFRETHPSSLGQELNLLRQAIAFWKSARAEEIERMQIALRQQIAAVQRISVPKARTGDDKDNSLLSLNLK